MISNRQNHPLCLVTKATFVYNIKVKLIITSIFLISINIFAAEIPKQWRFEYNYGKVNTNYNEDQPSIIFDKKDIEQISDYHEFVFQYYLVPPFIDISFGLNTTGTQTDSPSDPDEQFRYVTGYANIGIVIPISDFWSFKIVGETFYTTMIVKDDEFGFQNLRGNQIYPEIEWLPFGSDIFIQFSPYAKIPIYSDSVGNRRETTIGLKMKIPLGSQQEMRFPTFAYQNALTIKIFYTTMQLRFQESNFISSEIETKQIGLTIGLNI